MLKANPKKKKVVSLSGLTKKLDTVTSLIVRLRDKRCVVCGSTQDPQCGHYISRRFIATRWDTSNCHQQCAGCNILHNSNPVPYTMFIQNKYGFLYPETLSNLAHHGDPLRRSDRLALLGELTAELKRLEALQ